MINCIVYTEVEIQSTSPHLIKFFSKKFLGNYPKIANHLFFKKTIWMVTLERQKMEQNTGKSVFFCMISTVLTKNGGGEAS